MAITIRSVADNLKRDLNDLAGDMFSEASAQIERYVIGNLSGTEQTFVFQLVAAGYFTCTALGTDALFFSSATPFTGAATDYELDAGTDKLTPYIKVTTGTETATQLTVTATRVDYRGALADILEWRGNAASMENDSQSFDGQTISAADKGRKLRRLARTIRGATGV